jgi:hypothetical protein
MSNAGKTGGYTVKVSLAVGGYAESVTLDGVASYEINDGVFYADRMLDGVQSWSIVPFSNILTIDVCASEETREG